MHAGAKSGARAARGARAPIAAHEASDTRYKENTCSTTNTWKTRKFAYLPVSLQTNWKNASALQISPIGRQVELTEKCYDYAVT